MPRIKFRQFDKGLWVTHAPDQVPAGGWRLLKGARPGPKDMIRSRWGSTLVQSVDANAIYEFNDVVFTGDSAGVLYRGGTSIKSDFSGTRLTFAVMQSEAGLEDLLYIAATVPASTVTDPDPDHTADFTWGGVAGTSSGKIFVQDGFTSTILDSESVVGVDTSLEGCSYDDAGDTPGVGSTDDKLYLWSSNITSTLKTSQSISAVSGSSDGVSHMASGDTGWVSSSGGGKAYVTSGQFTATIKTSQAYTYGGGVRELSLLGTNTLLGINDTADNNKIKVISGQYTTTVKVSTNAFGRNACSFDGRNWMGMHDDNSTEVSARKYSGLVTSTIKTSVGITVSFSVNGQRGMESNLFSNRTTAETIAESRLYKVDRSGTVTFWGIRGPSTGVVLTTATNGAGNLTGDYAYKATYLNSSTGARSNPSGASTTLSTSANAVTVTIPAGLVGGDAQVDIIEIWRTVSGGARYFKLGESLNAAGTFADNTTDANLEAEELPTDNGAPTSAYQDAVGPFDGRMWWGRVDTGGQRGRIFYSPPGRPESDGGGSIILGDDDDQVQKLVIHGGALYVFTTRGIYQVVGIGGGYTFRRVPGVPGTTTPFTVVSAPAGIFYQATDGVRVLAGNAAPLVGGAALVRLFRGEDIESQLAFEGVVGCYARGEYFISDTHRTFAFDVDSGAWRELGVGLNAAHYAADDDELLATIRTKTAQKVVKLEEETVLLDDTEALPFEVETWGERTPDSQDVFVQRLYFDVDTRFETLTATVVIDGTPRDLGDITTTKREVVEWPVGRFGKVMSVRLRGSLRNEATVYGIEADVQPASASA